MKVDLRERLDIIFEYKVIKRAVDLVSGSIVSEKAIKDFGVSGVSVIERIIRYLNIKGVFDCTTIDGDIVSLEDFYFEVKGKGKWVIPITAGGMLFRFGNVADREHCFLVVKEVDFDLKTDWNDLVGIFCDDKFFVQSWISNEEFNFWQNQTDIDSFLKKGVSRHELKVISNGLPFPLEDFIVDISNNPGRRVLRDGYVEAIGSVMWFSDLFWSRVGFEKKQLISQNNNFSVNEKNSIVVVVSNEVCFFDYSTIERQLLLRSVLYS